MNTSPFLGTDNELNIHRETYMWSNENALVQKMLFMISPQGKPYETTIPTFLSYQLKSLRHLNFFDVALLRDGALPLVKFFLSHREPTGFSSRILVHEDLSYLVPLEWREQVFYYRTYETNDAIQGDTLLLFGSLDSFASPISSMARNLQALSNNQYKKCVLLASMAPIETEEKLLNFDHHYFEVIKLLVQKFPNLEVKNWNDVKLMNFNQICLHSISDNRFWIADSYLEHFARIQGARAAIIQPSQYKIIEQIRLSSHHGFEIHQGYSEKDCELARWLYHWYDAYESIVFREETYFPIETEDHKKSQLCTSELMSFVLRATEKKFE